MKTKSGKVVRLKNGETIESDRFEQIVSKLGSLWNMEGNQIGILAIHDLLERSRDNPNWSNGLMDTNEILTDLELMGKQGEIPEDVRNVVLSAFTGSGMRIKARNPEI
jgi:hypothetical protein